MRLVVPLGLSLLVLSARVALAAPPAGYYQVWSDEFAGSNVNWSVWAQHQPGWRRDAYNLTNALTVSNGVLVITTYTEGGTNFTGMIDTKPSFRQRFGYWESSINYDTSNGMWSSFWLMPATIGNPLGDPATAGTEIDITEHRKVDSANTDISDKTVHNLHWDGYGADHKSVGSGLTANLGLAANYHTYAVRWTDTNYTFFVDGTQTWTTTSAVSRRTERVILSSEVEDNSWAGDIPPGGYGTRANSTVKMLVDYVRYYAPTSVVFWTGGGTTATWTNSANWVAARIPTEDFEVVFGDLTTNRFTCSLDRDFSLHRLTINELDTPLVISNNTLSLNTGGIDMVAVNAGNATILSAITLVAAQTWIVGSNRTLTIRGPLSGAGGLIKLGLGTVVFAGTNTYTGSTTISNGALLANLPGGTLAFHGAVTNHATLRATNGTVMEFFAPVINRGVIDAIEGSAIFHAPFINTGSLLEAGSVVVHQAAISNQAFLVQIPSVVGHNYQLQSTASLAPPAWTNAQASQPGTGAVLTFADPGGATNKAARYYRVRLVP